MFRGSNPPFGTRKQAVSQEAAFFLWGFPSPRFASLGINSSPLSHKRYNRSFPVSGSYIRARPLQAARPVPVRVRPRRIWVGAEIIKTALKIEAPRLEEANLTAALDNPPPIPPKMPPCTAPCRTSPPLSGAIPAQAPPSIRAPPARPLAPPIAEPTPPAARESSQLWPAYTLHP